MNTANLNMGKALRMLMTDNDVTAKQLGFDLNISGTTVSTLRRNQFMSGENLNMLANYFKVSAADFVTKGEE